MSNETLPCYETKEMEIKLKYKSLYKGILEQLSSKHHDMSLHKVACQNENCGAIGVLFFYGDNQVGTSFGCNGFVLCEDCFSDSAVCNGHISDFVKTTDGTYICIACCKKRGLSD
jgi:hypothetical protein